MNAILLYILMPAIIGITLVVVVVAKYPIKVIIFEKRANGFTVKYGKAGRIKNKTSGVWEYKMNLPKFPFGEKKVTKPQEYENIYMDSKGKPILFVYSDGKDQYVPCGMAFFEDMLKSKIKVLDEDLRQFQVYSYRDSESKYKGQQDFWAKYGGVINLAILAIAILLIFYSSRYLYFGIAEQNAQSSAILDSLKGMTKVGQVATGG